MKRLISLLLIISVFFTLPVSVSLALSAYTQNKDFSTALFLSHDGRIVGQQFVPDFTTLSEIDVYLDNTVNNNDIVVDIYEGSANSSSCTLLRSDILSLTGTGAKWYNLKLSSPVPLKSGVLHSFTFRTTSKATWFGTVTSNATYEALNYDATGYGGWVDGNIGAFIVYSNINVVEKAISKIPASISYSSEEAIVTARSLYNKLSTNDKSKVSNYSTLTSAESKMDTLVCNSAEPIISAINNIGEVTRYSKDEIENVLISLKPFVADRGFSAIDKISNYDSFQDAITTYNDIITYVPGDIDQNTVITSSDALYALQQSVNRVNLSKKQFYSADVILDDVVTAGDALTILQYSVELIDSFDDCTVVFDKIDDTTPLYTNKTEVILSNTYQSMFDRTERNGYAKTSLMGVYDGMFGRDSSIQIMAHIAAGDYEQAKLLLTYVLDYHKRHSYNYVVHIMDDCKSPISTQIQPDATFFFLHAWYLYVSEAPASSAKTKFINAYSDQIKSFANYYLEEGYIKSNNLIYNPCFEHTRENRYWKSYDLLTNVYASQSLYEMSLLFAQSDSSSSSKWRSAADKIKDAIHQNLVCEIDGKKMYAELIDAEHNDSLIKGFSWVNLAPMGCDWYGTNDEYLENTYQLYLKYGSKVYYNQYQMLEACTTYTGTPNTVGDHVIGKGLAWEILYCQKTNRTERLRELVSFIETNSNEMFRETWAYNGGGGDTANQEHANWIIYSIIKCFPEIEVNIEKVANDVIRVSTYNVHIFSDANFDTIAKDITDNKIDIVGIQEVDNNASRSGRVDQAKTFAEKLGWHYYYSKTFDFADGGEYGHAIISKYPIISTSTIQLTSTGEEQRVFGHVVIDVNGKQLNVLNTHLTWSGLQSTQFNEIANYTKNLNNFIITGDFNCSDFSAFNVIGGDLVNNPVSTFGTCGDGPIDNIVVSNNIIVGTGTMKDYNHSDHNMLFADIKF